MAAERNSRSISWKDKITNHSGKQVNEFIASNYLHVNNEETEVQPFTAAEENVTQT